MPSFLSEDDIEREIIRVMTDRWGKVYAFTTLNCHTEDPKDLNDGSHRTNKRNCFLPHKLREAVTRLNEVPESAVEDAIAQLTARRGNMSMVAANREIAALIRDGATVQFDDAHGRKQTKRVKFIDFDAPVQNTFTAVTQMWIQGIGPAGRFRRPDILLFVNGIPLVFIELKNSNVNVQDAYTKNLTDYKEDIPQLFHANAVCILSNAIETRVGSMTATWEFFFQWLRTDDEKEKIDRKKIAADTDSLPRVIDGLGLVGLLMLFVLISLIDKLLILLAPSSFYSGRFRDSLQGFLFALAKKFPVGFRRPDMCQDPLQGLIAVSVVLNPSLHGCQAIFLGIAVQQ